MLTRWLLSCIFALALPAFVFAAPPPECSCDVCLPDPTLKCKLPSGGQTTCGIFMRSGICLGEGFVSVEPQDVSPEDLLNAETDSADEALQDRQSPE